MQDEITVTLSEGDFVEAYRPAPRPRRLARLLLLLAAMLALLIVVLLVRYQDARQALLDSPLTTGLMGAVILCAVLVAALLIAAPTLRRKAARNTLATHPGLTDPVHYAFDAEHFEVRTTYTSARYPWPAMWDWREGKDVIIVLPSPRNFYVVPKRGIENAVLDRLRGYLGQTVKRSGGS